MAGLVARQGAVGVRRTLAVAALRAGPAVQGPRAARGPGCGPSGRSGAVRRLALVAHAAPAAAEPLSFVEAELGPLPLYRVDGSEVLVAEVLETPVVVALLRHFG